jgi:hypothetical protein
LILTTIDTSCRGLVRSTFEEDSFVVLIVLEEVRCCSSGYMKRASLIGVRT